MTTDTLTTITHLIQSPPGQLAAGGVLAGIVWKFFERVEAVLTDQTKLEIAVWLLGVKVGQKVEPWPDTFAKMFDRVFTPRHLSWKCCLRATAGSATVFSIVCLLQFQFAKVLPVFLTQWWLIRIVIYSLLFGAAVDYVSLLETRVCLAYMQRHNRNSILGGLLLLDLLVTFSLSNTAGLAWTSVWVTRTNFMIAGLSPLRALLLFASNAAESFVDRLMRSPWGLNLRLPGTVGDWTALNFTVPFLASALFTSIWLWLYAGSGFILKAARRFDIGFDWFNRKFDTFLKCSKAWRSPRKRRRPSVNCCQPRPRRWVPSKAVWKQYPSTAARSL